jgi:hypothetical protein
MQMKLKRTFFFCVIICNIFYEHVKYFQTFTFKVKIGINFMMFLLRFFNMPIFGMKLTCLKLLAN